MVYYKTCPECGANLDPDEKCNCKQILHRRWDRSSDALIIGYDMSDIDDVFTLTVGRRNADDTITILNTFRETEARALHSILTSQED